MAVIGFDLDGESMERIAETMSNSPLRGELIESLDDWFLDEGDAAFTEFLEECPGADRQHLRQLLRAAQRDREIGRPDAVRKLFKALRTALEEAGD